MLLYYNKRVSTQTMIDLIPKSIREIYTKLEKENFEVYFVGGCVRNLLMGLPVKDWDLTTNATPEQILKLFPDGYYNNEFGTVGIPLSENNTVPAGRQVVEITTYRTEHGFSDRRHPEKVKWGKTVEEDLSRRDFTMNAIALAISYKPLAISRFVDPFDGQSDIKKRVV